MISVRKYWFKSIFFPLFIILISIIFSLVILIRSALLDVQKNSLSLVSNTLSAIISDPVIQNDHIEILKRIGATAKKNNLSIRVYDSKNNIVSSYPSNSSENFKTYGTTESAHILSPDGIFLGVIYVTGEFDLHNHLLVVAMTLLCLLVLILIGFYLSFTRSKKILSDIEGLINHVENVGFKPFFVEVDSIKNKIMKQNEELILMKREEIKVELAENLAHDIRSPLTALSVALQNIKRDDDSSYDLINRSILRIRDISNKLLSEKNSKIKLSLFYKDFSDLIEEKKIEYNIFDDQTFEFIGMKSVCNSVLNFPGSEFKNILSNILNNSLQSGNGVKLKIKFRIYKDSLSIKIHDNGSGISRVDLKRVGTKGFTTKREKGHGLGIYSIKKLLHSNGCRFDIRSKLNKGTVVSLSFPLVKKFPKWYLEKLFLSDYSSIIVLDDQEELHAHLKKHLSNIKLNLVYHSKVKEFVNFYNQMENKSKILFLIDYSLGNELNGIDLILKLGINDTCILVSNDFLRVTTRLDSESAIIKFIPKSLFYFRLSNGLF